MGMFDHLRCQMPLPVDWPNEGFQFQTKETDAQYMERYTITADGRLVHHAVRYEDTPQAELPYPDAEPGSWQSMCGIIRSVPTGDVEVPMHGDLGFHDLAESGAWVRFVARFTEGRCVRIWCDELRPPTKREFVATLDDAMPTEGKIAALKAAGFLFREGCDTPENAHAAGKVTIEKDDVSETTRYRMWVPLPASATEAQRAETGTGSVHEGAVGNAETPNPLPQNHHARSGTGSDVKED